jgi:hypothetical protein
MAGSQVGAAARARRVSIQAHRALDAFDHADAALACVKAARLLLDEYERKELAESLLVAAERLLSALRQDAAVEAGSVQDEPRRY